MSVQMNHVLADVDALAAAVVAGVRPGRRKEVPFLLPLDGRSIQEQYQKSREDGKFFEYQSITGDEATSYYRSQGIIGSSNFLVKPT
jgi:hypothetical protein